jgi:hypothetical protein
MLHKLGCSESVSSAEWHLHINEYSVRTIKRSQTATTASAEESTLKNVKVTYKSSDPCVEEAETFLCESRIWHKGKVFV